MPRKNTFNRNLISKTEKNVLAIAILAYFLNFLRFFNQITVEILLVLEYNDTRVNKEGQMC